jgi:tetratricopeptide (TPR) repeat protein
LAELKRLSAGITDVPTQSRESPLFDAAGGNRRRVGWAAAAIVASVMAFLGMAGRGRWLAAGTPAPISDVKVVAVLPLLGGAGDPQNDALAAGVADALITTLSKVPGLTVVSRAATLKYQDRKMEPDAIAAELGATMLVDGTVQRSGNRLKVSLSLLQPGSTVALWQNAYDGPYAQMFELQREVADAVAEKLRLPDPGRATEERPTRNVEAFADYAQARTFVERPDVKENLDRGIALFQSALARDPRFARAHAGLGDAYWRKYRVTRDEKWSVHARDEINEALRLDPHDAEVRLSLATIYRAMGRTSEAEEELRKVIVSSPQSDEAHRQLGQLLLSQGDDTAALSELQQAVRLRPTYMGNLHTLGTAYYGLGKFAEAAQTFERIIQLQPDSSTGYSLLGATRHALDDTEAAAALYEKAISLGNANAYSNLGSLQLALGQYGTAARHLAEAVKRDGGSAVLRLNLADAYARLGRNGEAKVQYAEARALSQAHLRVNPTDTKAIARMAVIESKLGFEQQALEHIERAVAREPRNMDVHYYRAVILVRAGRLADALEALDDAIRCGYSRKRASRDPDLTPLRSLVGYSTLMGPAPERSGQ